MTLQHSSSSGLATGGTGFFPRMTPRFLKPPSAVRTGWFQFTNTDSRVHRVCAELIEAGAKPTQIYDSLYHNFSHARFTLMAAMLDSVELHL